MECPWREGSRHWRDGAKVLCSAFRRGHQQYKGNVPLWGVCQALVMRSEAGSPGAWGRLGVGHTQEGASGSAPQFLEMGISEPAHGQATRFRPRPAGLCGGAAPWITQKEALQAKSRGAPLFVRNCGGGVSPDQAMQNPLVQGSSSFLQTEGGW